MHDWKELTQRFAASKQRRRAFEMGTPNAAKVAAYRIRNRSYAQDLGITAHSRGHCVVLEKTR